MHSLSAGVCGTRHNALPGRSRGGRHSDVLGKCRELKE